MTLKRRSSCALVFVSLILLVSCVISTKGTPPSLFNQHETHTNDEQQPIQHVDQAPNIEQQQQPAQLEQPSSEAEAINSPGHIPDEGANILDQKLVGAEQTELEKLRATITQLPSLWRSKDKHKQLLFDIQDILRTADKYPKFEGLRDLFMGDTYAGLTRANDVNLPLAFKHYLKAVQHNIPDRGHAHYMIAFIAEYHNDAATDDYRVPHYPASHDSPLLRSNRPNMPAILLHLTIASKLGNIAAMSALAQKHLGGHYTRKQCPPAGELLQQVTDTVVESARHEYLPPIKLGSDKVDLANEYTTGKNIVEEENDLIEHLYYTANRSGKDVQFALGILMLKGHPALTSDGQPNYAEAHRMFRMASGVRFRGANIEFPDKSDGSALAQLGLLYLKGLGVEANNSTALALFTKGAQNGAALAQRTLGLCYLKGDCGVTANKQEALKYFNEAAAQEDPDALFKLAQLQPASERNPAALLYYQRAGQAGHLPALWELGTRYLEGFGMPPSCAHAVSIFQRILTMKHHKELELNSYLQYASGRYSKALLQFEMLADQGSISAQLNVAWLYNMHFVSDNSLGYNLTEASETEKFVYWSKIAASKDSSKSNLLLGDAYYYGEGVTNDYELAAQYYLRASTLQNSQASFNLGYMHQYGVGLSKDLHLAKRYYDVSSEQSRDAYYPVQIALASLNVQAFVSKMGADGETFSIGDFGLAWDTTALIVLSALLVVSFIVRGIIG